MEFANETFAAAGKIKRCCGVRLWFRNRDALRRRFQIKYSAVFVSRSDRGSVSDETEQQRCHHAG